MKNFPVLGPNFKVEATLSFTQFDPNHRRNIFRLTRINGDYEDSSDRIPSVWLNEDHQLEICFSLPENKLFCKMHKVNLGESSHLVVEQKDGVLSIVVNDEIISRKKNPSPEVFKDVTLFTSDPWSLAFTEEYGTIDDLVVFAVTQSNTSNFCNDGLPAKIIDNLLKDDEAAARSNFCVLSKENKRKLFNCTMVSATNISMLMTPDVYCGNSLSWDEQEDEDFFIYAGIQNDLNEVCDDYCLELREEAENQIEKALNGSLDHFDSEIKGYNEAREKFDEISTLLLDMFKEWDGQDPNHFRDTMEKNFKEKFGNDWQTGPYKDGIKRIRDTFEDDIKSGTNLESAKAKVDQKMAEQVQVINNVLLFHCMYKNIIRVRMIYYFKIYFGCCPKKTSDSDFPAKS